MHPLLLILEWFLNWSRADTKCYFSYIVTPQFPALFLECLMECYLEMRNICLIVMKLLNIIESGCIYTWVVFLSILVWIMKLGDTKLIYTLWRMHYKNKKFFGRSFILILGIGGQVIYIFKQYTEFNDLKPLGV